MSDILKQIYNNCDPKKPAEAEYYVDCSVARGNASALAQEFQRNLELVNGHLCFLFSGHIGCGKSSELAELSRILSHASSPRKRYFPVLVNLSDYLDDYDVAPSDVQLAIVSELAAALHEGAQVNLKDNYFVKRFEEIKRFFFSDREVSEGELNLGIVKSKLQRLKTDPTARQNVRNALQSHLSTMKEEMNTVFHEARLKLRQIRVEPGQQAYEDFVLILDNLERIRKIDGFAEGEASHRELFVERYAQFTGMAAHVIYTMPLRLVRSADGPQLEQRYGPLFVLPMVKVMERGTRAPYEKGNMFLRELLQKRIENHKLDEVFTPDALDFLLTYSGGHMRNLMIFIQRACTYTDNAPIALAAAQRAIGQAVRTYSTSIPESHWIKLAQLERSADQQIPNSDEDYLRMLENLSVLEYVNGGSENNPFAPAEPWYAVNPIVRELQKFQSARKALDTPPLL